MRWSQKPLRTFLTLRSAETREAPGGTLVKHFCQPSEFLSKQENKVELNLKNWEDFYAGAVLVVLRSSTSTPTSTFCLRKRESLVVEEPTGAREGIPRTRCTCDEVVRLPEAEGRALWRASGCVSRVIWTAARSR